MNTVQMIEGAEDYAGIVFVNTIDSIHDVSSDIEMLLREKNVTGDVVIDTLLHTGNDDDRFYVLHADNGSVDWVGLTQKDISRGSSVRSLAASYVKEHESELCLDLLTGKQRRMLAKGIGI